MQTHRHLSPWLVVISVELFVLGCVVKVDYQRARLILLGLAATKQAQTCDR